MPSDIEVLKLPTTCGSSVTIGITNNGSTDALTLVNADFNLDVGVSNRGFLITPIPEPSSGLGLLALGLLGAGAVLKRHWN
ncbi:PEP-CTERM sorting domain-containing protein [Microcystis aeruginosa]|uniref:PEP-CTERM sorting domain-containing protein n=1 Tax=Microcystis aeruginosa TaxID=1126 RepID=UPI00232A9B43|nr:PEP-CTERM sorting domain-containing protein [Microcystis aeruginosa]MDB9434687.1 PEP-CTERM sorting domain-containing protein [Microcystis aeruginosa CS-552/01]